MESTLIREMSEKYQRNCDKRYKKLKVWHKADEFVKKIYTFTAAFPKCEEYNVTSQIRRSALSIPLNIVEGQASISKKEFLNFLNIANRSLAETEYLLEISVSLQYLNKCDYEILETIRFELGSMLNGLIRSLRNMKG